MLLWTRVELEWVQRKVRPISRAPWLELPETRDSCAASAGSDSSLDNFRLSGT